MSAITVFFKECYKEINMKLMAQTLTMKYHGLHMKPDFCLSFLKTTDFLLNHC